jgi:hypothetical protein
MLTITNDSRIMCDIERILRVGTASTPRTVNYDKERVESHGGKIQQTLGTLHALRLLVGEGLGADKCAPTLWFLTTLPKSLYPGLVHLHLTPSPAPHGVSITSRPQWPLEC